MPGVNDNAGSKTNLMRVLKGVFCAIRMFAKFSMYSWILYVSSRLDLPWVPCEAVKHCGWGDTVVQRWGGCGCPIRPDFCRGWQAS